MPTLSAYIIMSTLEAARFRDITAGDENRLEPIEIIGGPYRGRYALPAAVKSDPEHRERWDAFAMCEEVALDIETAFPQSEARGI